MAGFVLHPSPVVPSYRHLAVDEFNSTSIPIMDGGLVSVVSSRKGDLPWHCSAMVADGAAGSLHWAVTMCVPAVAMAGGIEKEMDGDGISCVVAHHVMFDYLPLGGPPCTSLIEIGTHCCPTSNDDDDDVAAVNLELNGLPVAAVGLLELLMSADTVRCSASAVRRMKAPVEGIDGEDDVIEKDGGASLLPASMMPSPNLKTPIDGVVVAVDERDEFSLPLLERKGVLEMGYGLDRSDVVSLLSTCWTEGRRCRCQDGEDGLGVGSDSPDLERVNVVITLPGFDQPNLTLPESHRTAAMAAIPSAGDGAPN
ncbi:hypothetical protein ACLOJK_011500 [Asimina triloba]